MRRRAERTRAVPAALEKFNKAIELNPDYAEAYSNRGNALTGLAQHAAALASFDAAIRLKPDFAEAHCNRGNTLYALGEFQQAVASFGQAIRLRPDYAEAYSNRGSALNELRQYREAIEDFDRAIALNPNYAEAYNNRANAQHGLRQYRAAIASCDRALAIHPGLAETWNNRGNAYHALQQYGEAERDFRECIRLKPDFADAYNNLGTLLQDRQQYPAALAALDRAIQLKPDFAHAYSNRGNLQQQLEQYPAALANFTQAMRLNPASDYAAGMRLHMKRFLCDWEDLDAESRHLEARIECGEKAAIPFPTLAISSSAALQQQAAEIYVRDRYPAPSGAAPIPRGPRRNKIRIGYFSADFRQHAVSNLMAGLFEQHDKSRFETVGFSFGPDIRDAMTDRIAAAMDQFLDVRSLSDHEVVELSRRLEVDIAVDLVGLTENNRCGIFAGRAAPLQVNYIGYPGTMGAEYIDYLIADSTLVPHESRQHYTEKIVSLPDSFQVNSRNAISDRLYTRREEGLPEQGFVFSCFNNSYKISPATFDVWMRVLGRVEGSVLWLLGGDPLTVANLRKEAARRGIAPERLVFARRLPLAEHLTASAWPACFWTRCPSTPERPPAPRYGRPANADVHGRDLRRAHGRQPVARHRSAGAGHHKRAGLRSAGHRTRARPGTPARDSRTARGESINHALVRHRRVYSKPGSRLHRHGSALSGRPAARSHRRHCGAGVAAGAGTAPVAPAASGFFGGPNVKFTLMVVSTSTGTPCNR